jgi:hypothetical protein
MKKSNIICIFGVLVVIFIGGFSMALSSLRENTMNEFNGSQYGIAKVVEVRESKPIIYKEHYMIRNKKILARLERIEKEKKRIAKENEPSWGESIEDFYHYILICIAFPPAILLLW